MCFSCFVSLLSARKNSDICKLVLILLFCSVVRLVTLVLLSCPTPTTAAVRTLLLMALLLGTLLMSLLLANVSLTRHQDKAWVKTCLALLRKLVTDVSVLTWGVSDDMVMVMM